MVTQSATSIPLRTGVLLVGHGTRSEEGRAQCETLSRQIATILGEEIYVTESAYLELASPTIDEAISQLTDQPISGLVVVPLLLFSAGHAQEDIPGAVRRALAAAGHSHLPLVQTPPLGLHPAVIELAQRRYFEVAGELPHLEQSCLLLISRGSRDQGATAQMRELGSILQQRLGIGKTRVGFLAMAEPSAAELIRWAAASAFRQIIVQPHLLFAGELLARLQQEVGRAAELSPHQDWRFAGVLEGTGMGNASPLAPVFSGLAAGAASGLRAPTNITT